MSPFFTSFWAAIEGRALSSLHRTAAAAAFLSSLLECTVFLLKRVHISTDGSPAVDANTLLKELFSRVWIEVSSQNLKVEERILVELLQQTLLALMDLRRMFFDVAWEAVAFEAKTSSKNGTKDSTKIVSALLKTLTSFSSDLSFRAEKKNYLKVKADELLMEISKDEIERVEHVVLGSSEEGTRSFDMLEAILEQFREELFLDLGLASVCGNNCVIKFVILIS